MFILTKNMHILSDTVQLISSLQKQNAHQRDLQFESPEGKVDFTDNIFFNPIF